MATLYRVCVKPDYRWPTARVSGRQFSKTPEVMNEAYVNDEMRTSPLLEVKLVVEPDVAAEPETGEVEED